MEMTETIVFPDQLVIFCQEIDGAYAGIITCPVEYPYGSDGRHGRVMINGHVGVVYQKYPMSISRLRSIGFFLTGCKWGAD